jgi:hypothetical protein
VIGREPGQGHGARWRCRCLACGAERVALSDKLRDGRVRCTRCPSEIAAQRDWSKEWPSWASRFEDSEEAIADHGSRGISSKGGRPRLPAAELERREAAKKPPGRPCADPCKQVMRECLWRWAEAARATGIDPTGIVQVARKPKLPSRRRIALSSTGLCRPFQHRRNAHPDPQ